jgi:hypothetical protein
MHAVSRAVRLPHGICNNLIFGSVWIRHRPEKTVGAESQAGQNSIARGI